MSKINQIQKALAEMDATRFHKLMDSYLAKRYRYDVHSNGAKTGEDKTVSGTPDSYVALNDDKYIFIEYTTQKSGVKNKLMRDIDKCLDEDKTKISTRNIEKIILACNSDLTPHEVAALKAKCAESNIQCDVFTNSSISHSLLNDYPSILQGSLGIKMDTRQILSHDDFIKDYNSSKYSTQLCESSLCREEDKGNLYQAIKNNSITLVTGAAGVGKTQLVLEVGSDYANAEAFEFKAILNRGADIFDDLRFYFNEASKKHLVIIDDANRIRNTLQYFLEYFGDRITKQELKIIATVRDYAKNQIMQLLPEELAYTTFELQALGDKEIKIIVEEKYGIHHSLYLKRIADITNGNPRLAIMAAKVAKDSNTFESISNASKLYDEYFSSVKNDLDILKDESHLCAIAIIVFFRNVDNNNQEQIQLISSAFNISQELLWGCVSKLHELEIVDLYENEIVKISDQILATYLFYKIVFVDKRVGIEIFLHKFFIKYPNKFADILNPILNTFDARYVIGILIEPVDELWKSNIKDEDNLYALMRTFWYCKQTDMLSYFKSKIDNLESEPLDLAQLNFWEKSNSNHVTDRILDQLTVLKHDSIKSTKATIELILEYLRKRPSILLDAIYVLTDSYGYQSNSYAYGYPKERQLFDTTWGYSDNGRDELYTKLFIRICSELLRTEFQGATSKGSVMTIRHFKIITTEELQDIRKDILEKLSVLYKSRSYQKDILKLIHEYPSNLGKV